jgi:hypothetical protein
VLLTQSATLSNGAGHKESFACVRPVNSNLILTRCVAARDLGEK